MNHRIFAPFSGVLPAGSFSLPATRFAQDAGHGMAPVFRCFDRDANGILDRDEPGVYLERHRVRESYADMWQYSTVDSEGDGGMSPAEWSSALGKELQHGAEGAE